MKNRRSCKQHPNDLPNDPFKKVFWWHSQLATNACGPQCDSCPFLSGKISGTWKIKLAVLVSGSAPKALPKWVANGEVGFLLSSVTHTRQCVLKVTGLWLTFYLITFPRYHFQCYLSNWNSTNPHNDELLSRGQWVERGVAPLQPLFPYLHLALLQWQTSQPKKSWSCSLRFSEPDVQMNVQLNNRKAYLKSTQAHLNLGGFHMRSVSPRFMRETVVELWCLPRGLRTGRYFHTKTLRQRTPWKMSTAVSPAFSHTPGPRKVQCELGRQKR